MVRTGFVKVILDSGYGNSCVGHMVNYFADKDTLVVRCNGGVNSGHTVCHNGIRHIFHHFGSGTLKGAPTYLADEFIVNPSEFRSEWEQLEKLGVTPIIYVNENCRITTPFDVAICRTLYDYNKGKRSTSGFGITNTIQRNNGDAKYRLKVSDCLNMTVDSFKNYLHGLRDGYINEIVLKNAPNGVLEILNNYSYLHSDSNLDKYIDDLMFFLSHITTHSSVFTLVSNKREYCILYNFKNIIFEGSLGLRNSVAFYGVDDCCAYHTGLNFFNKYIAHNELDCSHDIEVIYCSRWYNMRYGTGRFEEYNKFFISDKIKEDTNVKTLWCGEPKFGLISPSSLYTRIAADSRKCREKFPKTGDFRWDYSLAISHLDQTNGNILKYKDGNNIKTGSIDNFFEEMIGQNPNIFYKVYGSFGTTDNDVKLLANFE
jgi:adenylosuccinate synthase